MIKEFTKIRIKYREGNIEGLIIDYAKRVTSETKDIIKVFETLKENEPALKIEIVRLLDENKITYYKHYKSNDPIYRILV